MKLLRFVFVGCLVATACRADEFFLKDAKGQQYGPFESRPGARIHAGGQEFEVAKATTPREKVIQAMQRIVLPEVEFRQANINCVAAFLTKESRERDPEKQGINIIVIPFNASTNAADAKPLLTDVSISARNISLYALIKTLRQITSFKVCVDGTGVRFMAPDEPESEILHQRYRVFPTFIERTTCGRAVDVATNETRGTGNPLKDTFAAMGMSWPRGSSISYNASVGMVLVANTAANLALFERLLTDLHVRPQQVEIEAQFVRFERTNLAHLASGPATDIALLGLWTNGVGRVLAAPRVITQSGIEAYVRGVTEVIYPTTFNSGSGGNTNANTNTVTTAAFVPADFQTREAGAILTVTPEVSPYGSLIKLTLSSSLVDQPAWRDFGRDVPAGVSGTRHVPMEQPFFHAFTCITQVSVKDGATVLAGGGVPTQDGNGLVYCFITAWSVGIDGEPNRKPDQPMPENPCEF